MAVLRGYTFTIFFCLLALWIICASSSAQEYLPPKTGGSKKHSEPTMPANYEFAYTVQESGSNVDFGHNEKRKDDKVTGSYHVLLPDGRMQLVEYEAGPDGYKPQIMYMGEAKFPDEPSGPGEGYKYAAASRHVVRHVRPRPPNAALLAPSHNTGTNDTAAAAT